MPSPGFVPSASHAKLLAASRRRPPWAACQRTAGFHNYGDSLLNPHLEIGLAATADVRTGTRAIISYLLSPLQTSIAQAGRER